MEGFLLEFIKGIGVSHLNAGLIGVIAWLVWKGFHRQQGAMDQAIQAQQKSMDTLTHIATDVKLTSQWCQLHEKEDDRRFNEVTRRLENTHGTD